MAEYKGAIHLLPPAEHYFPVKATTCSAYENSGMDEIYSILEEFQEHTAANGYRDNHRKEQNVQWLKRHLKFSLLDVFYGDSKNIDRLKELESKVKIWRTKPFQSSGASPQLKFLGLTQKHPASLIILKLHEQIKCIYPITKSTSSAVFTPKHRLGYLEE